MAMRRSCSISALRNRIVCSSSSTRIIRGLDMLLPAAPPPRVPRQIAAPSARESAEARLPRNIEAEAAFLGALLIDNRIAEEVGARLKAEHFFESVHQRLYAQILKLID